MDQRADLLQRLTVICICLPACYGVGDSHAGAGSGMNQRWVYGGDIGFDLSWHSIDGGGGRSTGGGFALCGTIGQPDAGTLAGGAFELRGGFRQVFASSCGSCPTDVSGDGITDGFDLAQLLGQWGPLGASSCLDSNGDDIIDGFDLAVLLGAWGPCQ